MRLSFGDDLLLFGDDLFLFGNARFLFGADLFSVGSNTFLLGEDLFLFGSDMFRFGDARHLFGNGVFPFGNEGEHMYARPKLCLPLAVTQGWQPCHFLASRLCIHPVVNPHNAVDSYQGHATERNRHRAPPNLRQGTLPHDVGSTGNRPLEQGDQLDI